MTPQQARATELRKLYESIAAKGSVLSISPQSESKMLAVQFFCAGPGQGWTNDKDITDCVAEAIKLHLPVIWASAKNELRDRAKRACSAAIADALQTITFLGAKVSVEFATLDAPQPQESAKS